MKLSKLLYLSLIFSTLSVYSAEKLYLDEGALYARCSPQSPLRKALEIKSQVDKANINDLLVLRDAFSKRKNFLDWSELKSRVFERLRKDHAHLKPLYESAKSTTDFALRSSLGKLVGVDTTGILQDAAVILQKTNSPDELIAMIKAEYPGKENEMTVMKNLLYYMNTELDQIEKYNWKEQIKMVYGAKIPTGMVKGNNGLCPATIVINSSQREQILEFVNRGYVFGGNQVVCKKGEGGSDCSAYVSHCVGAPRLATSQMEMVWKYQMGKLDSKQKADFQKDRAMVQSLKNYDAIDAADVRDLQTGDVVVWRKKTGGGHTGFFVGPHPQDPNLFIALTNKRTDDKTEEGMRFEYYELNEKDGSSSTYVLRSK